VAHSEVGVSHDRGDVQVGRQGSSGVRGDQETVGHDLLRLSQWHAWDTRTMCDISAGAECARPGVQRRVSRQ